MKRRRTKYCRAEAPLGEVRIRYTDAGTPVRMIKIRMDGPTGLRWIQYARWWWEKNRGPVPKGMRVGHADGNLLNDDPSNIVLVTPGQVIKKWHELHPEKSRANRIECGRHASRRNVQSPMARRNAEWLRNAWYAVDLERRVIHNAPRRKRWQIYIGHGAAQQLAQRLQGQLAAARAGDVEAGQFVLEQASRLKNYWRWLRPAMLGWPGTSCLAACILHVLADAGGQLLVADLLNRLMAFRLLCNWRPYAVHPHALSLSKYTSPAGWIRCQGQGNSGGIWSIDPEALAARVPGNRIVAVRGRELDRPQYSTFTKLAQPPVWVSTKSEVAA